MYKTIALLILFLLTLSCIDNHPTQPTNINNYTKKEINNINPFIILDQEENVMMFYGQDTLSLSGYGKTDGEDDLLMLKKYNKKGDLLIDEINIIKTKAILGYVVFEKNNEYYVIWLDPRNNTNYIANVDDVERKTQYVDIYYKIIDRKGTTIQADTKLTKELLYYKNARENYKLTGIYDGTMKDLQKKELFFINGTGKGLYPCLETWVLIDNLNYEYHFKIYGNHMLDSCKITYSKLSPDSYILVNEKEIAKFKKTDNWLWGPTFQNLYISTKNYEHIYLSWQLNDGRNNFIYYLATIDAKKNSYVYNKIGVKYTTIVN